MVAQSVQSKEKGKVMKRSKVELCDSEERLVQGTKNSEAA